MSALTAIQAKQAMEYIRQRQASGEITHLEYAVFLNGSEWAAAELAHLRARVAALEAVEAERDALKQRVQDAQWYLECMQAFPQLIEKAVTALSAQDQPADAGRG